MTLAVDFMASEVTRAVAATGLRSAHVAFPVSPLDDDAWTRLLSEVRFHRILGHLVAAILSGELPALDEQLEQASAARVWALETCLRLEADLLDAVDLLRAAGVDVTVLKGPATAHLDYEDPSRREFGDIDVLVRSEHWDDAVATLRAAGYERRYQEVRRGFDRRFGKGACFRAPVGTELDVHRTLVMGPFGLTIPLSDLWDGEGTPLPLAGRVLRALPPELRFLHACYHAALGNPRRRLVPVRDVVEMLERARDPLDLDAVLEIARRWKGEIVVARAVRIADDTFGLGDHELARWARGRVPDRRESRALATYSDVSVGYAARSFAALSSLDRWRDKAAFAFAMAFPDRRFGAGRHSGRWRRWRAALGEIARSHRGASS